MTDKQAVLDALQRLPENASLEEIAEAMGLEANTVKVKLFRARQRLKEKLERLLKHEVNELI